MAVRPNISDEEIQLRKRARRRLVGAIALVVAMAAILPMVLDSEPKPVGQDIAITIPSQQSGDFSSRIAPAATAPEAAKPAGAPAHPPVVAAPAPAAVPAQPEKPAPTPAAAPSQPEKPAEKAADKAATDKPAPASAKTAEHAKEAKSAASKDTPHKGGGFVVLLGAFSSDANARQRQAKLKELGVKFHVETVKTPAGDKIGVRAGPYASRAEAERARDKLKAAGIQDGVVAEKK